MSKACLYYIIIALVLVGKTAYTLYERSLVVHHGVSITQYHREQRQLNQEKTHVLAELAEYRSISTLKSSAQIAEFVPIKNVMVVAAQNNVASLQ